MKIVILGSGPAGLMAAEAAMNAHKYRGMPHDLDIAILSLGFKSPLYGCQYLHKPIPGVTPNKVENVGYRLIGTPEQYRTKVYGPTWVGPVSPEDLTEEHLAWDIRETYEQLWTTWSIAIQNRNVTPAMLVSLLEDQSIDLIINSIPRPTLCHQGHTFGATTIWAAGDAPDLGIKIPYKSPEAMVTCNGEDSPAWYRMSRVFGHTTVEWPGGISLVPVQTASKVQKPTTHDCTCWHPCDESFNGRPLSERLMHVGRYGRWEKGVLSHTAYFDVLSVVEDKLMEGVGSVTADEEGA